MLFNKRNYAIGFVNGKRLKKGLKKATKGKRLRILTLKQMLQRLLIALGQVKAGNTSGNLLNAIHQIIHFLYQPKDFTKKVCNNIMNSIKL